MECEICGRTGKLFPVAVQGSQVWVCSDCKDYGVEIKKQKKIPARRTRFKIDIEPVKAEMYELVDNYGQKIRQARQKLGLKHEEFAQKIAESDSFVKKIEAEKLKPPEKTIKKIERLLNIKIYKKVEE